MRILDQGLVFDGSRTPEISSCTFPAICKLRDGRLFASFKGSPLKGPTGEGQYGYTCISSDGGRTWTKPLKKFSEPVVEGNRTTIRTLYYLGLSGRKVLAVFNAVDATHVELPYYNEETEGLMATYIMVALSEDGGETFETPRRVDVETFKGEPLPLTGSPFLLEDGTIGIQFEVNKHYYETKPWVHHSVVVYSHDEGKTWGDEVVITDHPTIYYWDQRISAGKNGVFDLFWTFDLEAGTYRNIHATSSADGRAFQPLWDTGLSGQPGNAVELGDGRLCCIYINRDSMPIIRLALSEDGGKTWRDTLTVYDSHPSEVEKKQGGMNEAWSEMGAFSVGHPYLLDLGDGTLMAYYYAGPSTHRTDVHWVHVAV